MEIGGCLKSDSLEEKYELQAAFTTLECLMAVRSCQDISLSHDMYCIRINPVVTKTSSLINSAISEKLIFLCSGRHMPQNKVIEHFHPYEYDPISN